MNKTNPNPCTKDCTKRNATCHATCKKYLAYAAQNEIEREERYSKSKYKEYSSHKCSRRYMWSQV